MERYFYRIPEWNGEFRNTATGWEEHQNLMLAATFVEESRDIYFIVLFDASRDLRVLLPVGANGQCYYNVADGDWTPLYFVDLMQPNFTGANLAILDDDWAAARDLTEATLLRLTEAVIVPTASVLSMRAAVKRIFHVNLLDPDPGDVPVEAFHFADLVSKYQTLLQGFAQQPPFVFEPDYTGTYQAWVIGVDDPTVHIAPHYFYMDRDPATMLHERAHTVLRLNGHPGGVPIPASAGDPQMSRDDAFANAYCYEGLAAALRGN